MKTEDLLAYVFECAISDREGLNDAYGGKGEFAEEAREDVKRFKALRSKLLPVIPTPKRGLAGIRHAMTEQVNTGKARFVSFKELKGKALTEIDHKTA